MKKFVDGVVRKNDPELEMTPDLDLQKRRFLKALGFLGLGAFFISLFPKKAQAIFFGSTMRSDTVGLKNIAGTAINPATEAKQDDIIGALDNLVGLEIPAYDYVSRGWEAGTFTETWTFKTGGSGGTTVATVVIVYDNVTMDNIVSVTKT